jgi:hypothetical protein
MNVLFILYNLITASNKAMIGFIMVIELIAYISLRQIVRIWENVFSW